MKSVMIAVTTAVMPTAAPVLRVLGSLSARTQITLKKLVVDVRTTTTGDDNVQPLVNKNEEMAYQKV